MIASAPRQEYLFLSLGDDMHGWRGLNGWRGSANHVRGTVAVRDIMFDRSCRLHRFLNMMAFGKVFALARGAHTFPIKSLPKSLPLPHDSVLRNNSLVQCI